ncbi:Fe-S protein [Candidatus Kinetoplastibacterium desouzaii TCC079E]|uniref:Fe-S protein n=1 Tax=Candidatus Kinetoplastidibacterium desouzai TCC079E TaxID=1208919 RepID=M1LNF7_9PROT|nr:DUF1289 domain-containing protein [Candidatus Kinetoplastibacterium desouzaii]AGF47227.1 Fe-S protein [Candidatus Kinetoplastibacterium desouzaii TCC079E]
MYKKNNFYTISSSNITQLSDSPCIAVCSTLFDDICRGCGRTSYEVSHWVCFDEETKIAIWERIKKEGYPRR